MVEITRKPIGLDRLTVSGFMFRSSVLRPPENDLPFWSAATNASSRLLRKVPSFSTSGSAAPAISVDSTTEPFGCGPLNTAAVAAIGSSDSGSGLDIALRSSVEASFGPTGLVSAALPRAAM